MLTADCVTHLGNCIHLLILIFWNTAAWTPPQYICMYVKESSKYFVLEIYVVSGQHISCSVKILWMAFQMDIHLGVGKKNYLWKEGLSILGLASQPTLSWKKQSGCSWSPTTCSMYGYVCIYLDLLGTSFCNFVKVKSSVITNSRNMPVDPNSILLCITILCWSNWNFSDISF